MKHRSSPAVSALLLGLATVAQPLFGADAASTLAAGADPGPAQHFDRGRPATPADLAEMAPLASLPLLTPASGDGDFRVQPPYAPAPEATPRPDVPKGKVVEFTLDAAGKIVSVSGIEGVTEGGKASQAARQWIAQLDASSGAPAGGVTIGQKWSADQAASSLPLAGLVWRSSTEYLRNEPCNPPNPDVPEKPLATDSTTAKSSDENCAVLLTHLNLVQPKPVHDPTPDEYRKNGVTSAGKWEGSGQSLVYVSLRTGTVISITQTGLEEMDVTLTSTKNTSMHYEGTIQSRSQVALLADANP